MKIHLLSHSGFMVETGKRNYVFDYWKDPEGLVEYAFQEGKELWFLVTHNHMDHFNPSVQNFDRHNTKYIVHESIAMNISKGQWYSMSVGDELEIEDVFIHMYGSTDAGGSFYVQPQGEYSMYHAGDFNWWHWLGDTLEANKEARELFERELATMSGLVTDVAFYPVDSRLDYPDPAKEGAREWGLFEFLDTVNVRKLLVPMHEHDLERGGWKPSLHFQAKYSKLPLFLPKEEGDSFILK